VRPCLAVLICVALAAAARAQVPTLRVRVLDYAGLPAATLGNFQAPARAVFAQSGIASEWPTCSIRSGRGNCQPLADRELYIKIVPQRPPHGKASFGTTVRQGSRGLFSYVFWSRVEQAARQYGVAPSLLLGHVVAHEAGHLLGLDHAASGIMQCEFAAPQILRAGQGSLRFSGEEGAALRDALGPRLAAGALPLQPAPEARRRADR